MSVADAERKPAGREVRAALDAAVRSQFGLVIGFARRLCRSFATAQDLVSAAVLLILEGRRIWDARVSMTTLICNVVGKLWIEKCRLVFPKRFVGGHDPDEVPTSRAQPDKPLAREEADTAYVGYVEEIRGRLKGKPLPLRVFKAVVDDDYDAETIDEQAARFHVDRDELVNARRVVRRTIHEVAQLNPEEWAVA
jgi:DNA-directed RNA polymerase specialized sigma24 family protein